MSESLPRRHSNGNGGSADGSGVTPLGRAWARLRGFFRPREGESHLRETLEEIIDEQDSEATEIDDDARTLIGNVLKLHDVTVYDVMVPRADIVAVEMGMAFSDLVELMSAEGHSRMPVYREALDDVCGMVHIKDVLAWRGKSGNGFSLEKIMRKILFVAPSMRVLDLLLEMRLSHVHMAMVVDEYGGVDGIVTIEDLVEEIVGEIEDEHDSQKTPIMIRRAAGCYDADARIAISEFEAQAGPILSAEEREEDIDTLGGLVFSLAGRVPGRGEVIRHGGDHEFEILDADPRRIRFLRIRVAEAPQQADETTPGTAPAPDPASAADSTDPASTK